MEHKVITSSIAGKRVLITGGTTGIGRATFLALNQAGAKLLTFGRHEPELTETLQLAGLPDEAGLTADVSRRDDVDRLFDEVEKRLGSLDVLICNAAVGASPIHEMSEDDWRYAVETNLIGYMACTRRAIGLMLAQGQGHIVMVSSISSEIMAAGESVYAATKAGLDAFALTVRKEIADKNIRISIVKPGSVGSDMQECTIEEQREAIAKAEMLYAEEIAEAILFILSRSERCDVVELRIEPVRQKT